MRGVKLAVTMEHLKGKYLTHCHSVEILPPKVFGAASAALENMVRWLLKGMFPGQPEDRLSIMALHAQGLNWYPFGRALSELCKAVRLRATSRERRRFIDIRNELVHRAAFHPNCGPMWDQYAFMFTFVGKILLGILGYDGHYLDWTKEAGWEGEHMKMRVKLDLKPPDNLKNGQTAGA